MSINLRADALIADILKTREYSELKKAYAVINSQPAIKQRVEEFQKKQAELFAQKRPDSETGLKITNLNETFKSLLKIPEVERYFSASKNFNNVLMKTFDYINMSIEKSLKS